MLDSGKHGRNHEVFSQADYIESGPGLPPSQYPLNNRKRRVPVSRDILNIDEELYRLLKQIEGRLTHDT